MHIAQQRVCSYWIICLRNYSTADDTIVNAFILIGYFGSQ